MTGNIRTIDEVADFLQNQYNYNRNPANDVNNSVSSDNWLLALKDSLLSLKDGDYKYVYIPIAKTSDYAPTGPHSNTVDKIIYNNGVFLTKDNPLGLTSTGVSIAGSGQYITYDFKTLSDAIGGFSGKTIKIEFNGLPTSPPNQLALISDL